MEKTPLYQTTEAYARKQGEEPLYHASMKENIHCAFYLDKARNISVGRRWTVLVNMSSLNPMGAQTNPLTRSFATSCTTPAILTRSAEPLFSSSQ